ncbi:Endoribonuclease E-like protein [Zea mays]|uniref:Endoribonuclease E-like protein n=1 Tax=Zea mays TaxID=4577 RepID=A0A1D6LEW9_MAIZE|nr:Endoribonuclease E-like protein [Zea mays]
MATNLGVFCRAPRPSPASTAAAPSQSLSPSSASVHIPHSTQRGRLAAAPPLPRCVASPTIANVKDQTEAEVAMGYTMTEICDKFIEFFMYMKPETKDWRKLLVFREEWQRYRGHFYKRCQVRIHIEADPSLKQKLVVLARKVKKIDDEIEKYMELFTELRENPADINAIVARRRKDFTGDFFRHLNFLVNAYNGLDERDGIVRLGAKCLSAIHAYDCTLEQLDIESAQLKFDDILNSSSLDGACDKIKSLAKAKELDSSLILLINRAWAAAKESTTMNDKVKDIMYHIYTTTKESLKSISPPEMKLLKTPSELHKWIKMLLDSYHLNKEETDFMDARKMSDPVIIQRLTLLKEMIEEEYMKRYIHPEEEEEPMDDS